MYKKYAYALHIDHDTVHTRTVSRKIIHLYPYGTRGVFI